MLGFFLFGAIHWKQWIRYGRWDRKGIRNDYGGLLQMAIPVLEIAGCVWCHENLPYAKVGLRLVCKPLLERNIPLVFWRRVYALLCLLRVINQVTNPHLFKVKDRSLGLVITHLFSVWPFSLNSSLAVEVQQSMLQWLVYLSFLEWLSPLCCWQCFFLNHRRCSGPTSVWCLALLDVCSDKILSLVFYPGNLPGGELSFL